MHIWISLGEKCQVKLIILIFRAKFNQKRYFQLRTEQTVQGLQPFTYCAVKVNSAVVFNYVEDLKDLNILNILKEKLIVLCLASWNLFILKLWKYSWLVKSWLNVDLNFSFKFYRTGLSNFTGLLKKLKLVMVMVKNFEKYHHLFNLHVLVFPWLRFKHIEYKGTLT